MFLCHCRRSKVGGIGFLKLISQHSLVLFLSFPSFFPALSLALFFTCALLSERLEQANCSKAKYAVFTIQYSVCRNMAKSFACHNIHSFPPILVSLFMVDGKSCISKFSYAEFWKHVTDFKVVVWLDPGRQGSSCSI